MTKAVIARKQGDDYQARFFWIQACRLFEPLSNVTRVGYEVDGLKGFDDVVVFYDPPILDEFGQPLGADHHQLKFHVNYSGAFTWKALMDPAFIGATSISLLQRLAALHKTAPAGPGRRYFITSLWPIHPDDALSRLVSGVGGHLRLDVLEQGGPGSLMGRLRATWREHLGVATDAELTEVLRPLRIQHSSSNLEATREHLNLALRVAGLKPVPNDQVVHPYDDLIPKLHAQGRTLFNREELKEICGREGLWCSDPAPRDPATQLGIRSFLRWAEYLEDKTDALLCLVRHFDGRQIRSPDLWREAVFPELTRFLGAAVAGPGPYHLFLETHASIAFAAGYCLDSKTGADIVVVQSTRGGKVTWRPAENEHTSGSTLWSFESHPGAAGQPDVALAISVTWDVIEEVQAHLARAVPTVGHVLSVRILPELGPRAVRGGAHATMLAEALVTYVRQHRPAPEGVWHLFIAAPNGFTFFLGQLGRSLGPCTLYEYGFDQGTLGGYQPSLVFPPRSQ